MGDEEAAADFFSSIMTEEDVLPMESFLKRIPRAPPSAKQFLERKCRDIRELEDFFHENDHLFYVDNGKVALSDEKFESDCEATVEFFTAKLKDCGAPVNQQTLKELVSEQAPAAVSSYIARFYPGQELKNFFKQRPEVFVTLKDDSVYLVEEESVEFYKKQLEETPGKQHFLRFRGHVANAPPHVQTYINRYYHGDNFQRFLYRNRHVFRVDDKGFVSLA